MSLSDFVSSSNLLNASWISESSYLPASTGTQPNSVWITAETSSAGGWGGSVWCIICPLHSYHTHSPGPACTTPNGLVWDSCTLCTPSWLPLILEVRLLDWMQVAWFGYTMHNTGQDPGPQVQPRHAVGPPCLQYRYWRVISGLPYSSPWLEHSRVWKGKEPALEDRLSAKSKILFAHKYCEEVRRCSELHLQWSLLQGPPPPGLRLVPRALHSRVNTNNFPTSKQEDKKLHRAETETLKHGLRHPDAWASWDGQDVNLAVIPVPLPSTGDRNFRGWGFSPLAWQILLISSWINGSLGTRC